MNPETTIEQFVSRMLADQGLVAAPWQKKLMAACVERESFQPLSSGTAPWPLRTQAELRRKPSVPRFVFRPF